MTWRDVTLCHGIWKPGNTRYYRQAISGIPIITPSHCADTYLSRQKPLTHPPTQTSKIKTSTPTPQAHNSIPFTCPSISSRTKGIGMYCSFSIFPEGEKGNMIIYVL
ncbi:hypothetical protein AAMO2058_000743900 [Amorphochlora amoebiformis]